MLAGLSATGSRATTWKAPFGLYMRRRGKALEKGALALQRPLVLGPWRVSCKLVEFLCILGGSGGLSNWVNNGDNWG